MADPRVIKLAHVLTSYSVPIKQGDVVVINSEPIALPLVQALYKEILQRGGYPIANFSTPSLARLYLEHGNDQQLEWVSPFDRFAVEQADVRMSIIADTNTRELSKVDPARQGIRQAARRELMHTSMRRSHEGSLRWTVTMYPTEGLAQDADMSLEDFENFVYDVCLLNDPDPVARWQELHAEQERLINFLKGKKEVRIVSQDTNVTIGIADRTFINCAGDNNFPDGEFFTGPEESKINGTVRFSFPAIYGGRQVEDVRLTFEDGKVVKATAASGQEFLEYMLNLDDGARRLGEFAFGNNPNVKNYTKNILFDEKMAGTIHMALGESYPETGGVNHSAIHWDLVCDLRENSEVYVDDVLFSKNGKFVI